jgi:rfaE bifunctional protein nucleotidyltransferase chain/domain
MNTVLAHGCFDMLHLGHIKHLQEARKLGDRLVVSITDDQYVSKGIGRPYFTAQQRATAIRALACVDDVVINDNADATTIIAKIRPSIYVKGIDYKRDDSASLAREKDAVEAVGGKIVFTDSEKFSSSRLINTERFSPEIITYLEAAKHSGWQEKILAAFGKADQLKVTFVGEVIIDEYRYVQGLGKASKEMMLAVFETDVETFEGGSIAASKHGDWVGGTWMATAYGEGIKKTRYVDRDFNRKLLDVYSARKVVLSELRRKQFQKHLKDVVGKSDVVVVMDFGHGLIEKEEREILHDAKFLALNAQTNAGNFGYNLITKYDTADFICIDDPEARLAAGMSDEPLVEVMMHLSGLIDCEKLIVTHGKYGSAWLDKSEVWIAPAFSSGGIDTMGAGDAVMAVTAPLVAAGLPTEIAAFVGNIAGAIKTSIVGHRRHVNRQEIIQTVEALLA